MTDREAYIAFNLIPNVGSVTVTSLIATAGSASEAWKIFPRKRGYDGYSPNWGRECERARRMGVELLTPVDAAYPASLKALPAHPLVLYVVGDAAALSKPGVAIVGTRAATPYGDKMANHFAYNLAQAGEVIFSGLAVGIDAAAHRGALAAKGVTVGILGGAIDKFFPKENRELARRIADNGGAVVSEFPFGRAPDKTTFPQRNRTVAALSRGVLAVEAPQGSGTIITCRLARKLGRPVMVVPANLDSPFSAGCWKLYRDGAHLVLNAQEVREICAKSDSENSQVLVKVDDENTSEHKFKLSTDSSMQGEIRDSVANKTIDKPVHSNNPSVALTLEEGMIYKILPEAGLAVELICQKTGLPPNVVNVATVSLRLKGLARFLPGARVARISRR